MRRSRPRDPRSPTARASPTASSRPPPRISAPTPRACSVGSVWGVRSRWSNRRFRSDRASRTSTRRPRYDRRCPTDSNPRARPRTGQSSRPCTAPARGAFVGRADGDGWAVRLETDRWTARRRIARARGRWPDWRRRRENVSPPRAPSRVGTPPMTRTRMTRTRPRDSRFPPTDDGSSVVAHPVRGSGRNPVRSRTKAEARGPRSWRSRTEDPPSRASSSCPRVGRERERERRGWGSNPRRVGRRRAVVAVVAPRGPVGRDRARRALARRASASTAQPRRRRERVITDTRAGMDPTRHPDRRVEPSERRRRRRRRREPRE